MKVPGHLRVCYFGTYRAEYSRNRIMIEALRQNGVEVVECNQRLWSGIEDRVQAASGGWKRPAFWLRVAKAYAQLLRQYRRVGQYDVLVAGYPGAFDVFLARLLAWLRRKPLVWDVFMSIYLIALERGLDQRSRFTMRLLRFFEGLALRLPDRLIQDTQDYVAWFGTTYGITPGRFRLVPTGADDRIYHPLPGGDDPGEITRVVYAGTFIPNHGVLNMLEATRCLANKLDGSHTADIQFEMIGEGPDRPRAEQFARDNRLANVRFLGWLEPEQVAARLATADIVLGAFGATPQSLMTVQNKIYEGLAVGRAVISGDSPAVRQLLQHGEDLLLVPRGDPQALAQAILRLKRDSQLRRTLGANGLATFRRQYNLQHLGAQFADHLREVAR